MFTTWLNRGSLPGAAQIACLMLAVVDRRLSCSSATAAANRRYAVSSRRARRIAQPVRAAAAGRARGCLLCASPVLLGFALPVGFLVTRGGRARALSASSTAPSWAMSPPRSRLAGAATGAALALGIVVVTDVAPRPEPADPGGADGVAGLGYAVPGTVLALGLLAPLVAVDNGLNAIWRALTGRAARARPHGLGGRRS